MKYIIVIICSIFLPIFSFKKSTPKLCINCKFFRKDMTHDNNNEYSKCSLFLRDPSNLKFLVTGSKYIDDYYYCVTARQYESMCGKEGNNYEKV